MLADGTPQSKYIYIPTRENNQSVVLQTWSQNQRTWHLVESPQVGNNLGGRADDQTPVADQLSCCTMHRGRKRWLERLARIVAKLIHTE